MKKHKHRPGRRRPLVRGGWFPKGMVERFNPNRYDFHWNANFTKFQPIRLRWWDDSSYAAYQGGWLDDPDYDERHKQSPKTAYGRRMRAARFTQMRRSR